MSIFTKLFKGIGRLGKRIWGSTKKLGRIFWDKSKFIGKKLWSAGKWTFNAIKTAVKATISAVNWTANAIADGSRNLLKAGRDVANYIKNIPIVGKVAEKLYSTIRIPYINMTAKDAATVVEDQLEVIETVSTAVADITGKDDKKRMKAAFKAANHYRQRMNSGKTVITADSFKKIDKFILDSKKMLQRGVYRHMVPASIKKRASKAA